MIRLNTEKGWARIDSWDDVLTRPGFVTDVDPKAVTLKSIIGSYAFSTFLPCGLSTCHTPHGRGYLVTTGDGRETNIGKDCGKKYFSVDFESMARTFDRELRAQERREAIIAFQHKIQGIETRLAELRSGEHGAYWVQRNVYQLTNGRDGIPQSVAHVLHGLVRRRNGAITVDRPATPDEIERMRAQGQRAQHGLTIVTDTVGQLDGVSALYAGNDVHELLFGRGKSIETIKGVDVGKLKDSELRQMSKWIEDIEPLLARSENWIAAGRRLLTRANIQQLVQFAQDEKERRAMRAFISLLPE